jgi:ADP-dependent NAD(P)H-hydrate dehydratase
MIEVTKTYILELYKPIASDTHKGLQGHALLIGGSYGKMGSVCLSSKAALKSGCGLVTSFIPQCGYTIIQIAIPEVMVLTDENEKILTDIHYDFEPNAIGIGIGMGQDSLTEKAFYNFIINNKSALIVDADALNILSKNKNWLSLLPKKTILTPHKKELERLIGTWQSEDEKTAKVIELSLDFDLIIVVKGAPTLIVNGSEIYENTTGNQALATAGSGDVLTGIITSLVAQNYEPFHAAILGVYIHGLTADIAVSETGYHSFVASDSIAYLGKAFLSIE